MKHIDQPTERWSLGLPMTGRRSLLGRSLRSMTGLLGTAQNDTCTESQPGSKPIVYVLPIMVDRLPPAILLLIYSIGISFRLRIMGMMIPALAELKTDRR